MEKIFITAPGSNTGQATINALLSSDLPVKLILGNRKVVFPDTGGSIEVENRFFDYNDVSSYKNAFNGCSTLLLVRPPAITSIGKVFDPLIKAAKECGITYIVFLSVQGADSNRFLPQSKIENLIRKSGIDFCFLRPAYFMQNFLTVLSKDIVERQRIYLPAGNTPFTLIDVEDIGLVAANVLANREKYRGKAYDLTCNERYTFGQMASIISEVTERPVKYISASPIAFFYRKLKEGMPRILTLVMLLLHFLPRFKEPPVITDNVKMLTGKKPVSFEEFVSAHRRQFT